MRKKPEKNMEIKVQAIHFDASEKLVDFINRKAERLARRFVNVIEMDFNLRVVKPETAMNKEVVMRVVSPHEEDMVATKVADTFEEAVDLAIEAVDRQLEKKKDRK